MEGYLNISGGRFGRKMEVGEGVELPKKRIHLLLNFIVRGVRLLFLGLSGDELRFVHLG